MKIADTSFKYLINMELDNAEQLLVHDGIKCLEQYRSVNKVTDMA